MVISLNPSDVTADERRALLLGSVVPRPIAWTSTVSPDGVLNLAPFSFFTVVSNTPPMLSLTIENREDGLDKDTLANIRGTGGFVVNIVPDSLVRAMAATSRDLHRDVDEFTVAGVTPLASECVRAPRVREAPISLECVLVHIVRPGSDSVVVGRVRRFHFAESVIDGDGQVDLAALRPVARLGRRFSIVRDCLDLHA